MKISAVICEYNPFHNGHKYFNEMAKSQCDALVAVMSSSFTQRGDIAVFSKYERTLAALKNGVDLVIELPAVYSVSPAQCFAESGAAIVSALGCINTLVFGSECGNSELLKIAANAPENSELQNMIRTKMNSGSYYPRALSESVYAIYGNDVAQIFSSPNDILAVEYCRALKNTKILPCAIKRKFTKHDNDKTEDCFASASYIRKLLQNGKSAGEYLPFSYSGEPVFLQNLARTLLYKLRSMTPADIASLPDVSEGLNNRIYSAVRSEVTIDGLLNSIKTKRYTMARLRRIFICALLDITRELRNTPPPYIRVLGFNSCGAKILKTAKTTATLPIITKVPDALKSLSDKAKAVLEKEIFASDIFALAASTPKPCGMDFSEPLIII